MKRALDLLTSLLPLWVILGGLWALLRPGDFAWTGWSLRYLLGGFLYLDSATPPAGTSALAIHGQPLFKWLFAFTMFSVGTVIPPESFRVLARQPGSIGLGLLTQFTVMPLLALGLTRLGGYDPYIALGFLIVGCAPGAMTSNVLTYLAGGDAAYSVTLTTLASLVAVFLTPLLVFLLGGQSLPFTWEGLGLQIWTLAWTVALPLLLGLGLRVARPRLAPVFETASPAIAVVAITLICCFVVQWTHLHLKRTTLAIALGVVAVNALGFLIGGLLGKVYRFPPARRITLSIEVGMQNAGMGVVLAVSVLRDRPEVAVPSALFTLWCIITASALIAVLRRLRERGEAPVG